MENVGKANRKYQQSKWKMPRQMMLQEGIGLMKRDLVCEGLPKKR